MEATFLRRPACLLAMAFFLAPSSAHGGQYQNASPARSAPDAAPDAALHPVASSAPSPAPGPAERSLDLPLGDGRSLRVLLSIPPKPRGTLIMLAGGTGDIDLKKDGTLGHAHNFVVRTRRLWTQKGYAVFIPDTIHHTNLRGMRSSPPYAHLIESLISLAHRQGAGPVFLLGTSQGAIAAVNGAAHAPPGSLAGVILTESVSVMGGSGETVFSAAPNRIDVPVLIVANRADTCAVAPPQAAGKIAQAMTASRDVHVLMVSGGITQSAKDCGSLTPHGYFGIEDQVVTEISKWLEAHS